jgi:3-oxoacyl-[acyl-carrier-protein] synthase-3
LHLQPDEVACDPSLLSVQAPANAANAALADAGLSAADIDEIIVASDTPEVYTPDTAAHLQHRLGAREITAYDLGGSGCAGFVLALDIARTRVHMASKKILVVGVELISRLMDWEDRNTCVLFGDAAGAVVVGEGDQVRAEILSAVAGTDGSAADILTLETGGTRRPFTLAEAQKGGQHDIVMNGREVYRHAVRRMTEAAEKVVALAGRIKDDVALVIPHQANLRILETVREKLGLKESQVYVNVDRYGNGFGDGAIGLDQARREGRIADGDLVVLTAFGAGFHWSAAALQF